MLIILTVVVSVISGIACCHITKNRNTNQYVWGALGVMLGPLIIPFAFMPKKNAINNVCRDTSVHT